MVEDEVGFSDSIFVLIAFSIKDELDKQRMNNLHKTDQGPDKYDASGEI